MQAGSNDYTFAAHRRDGSQRVCPRYGDTAARPNHQRFTHSTVRGGDGSMVENANTILKPQIQTAAAFSPEKQAIIKVSEANGKAMTYTLAVVDEGLLDLTNFKTPEPHKQFYKTEALGVRTWDMYKFVMGAFEGSLAHVLSIGGDMNIKSSDQDEGLRFKPVVKFMGPFTLERRQNSYALFQDA